MSGRDLFLALGKDQQTECTDGTSILLSSLPRSRWLEDAEDLSSEVRPSDEADGDDEGHERYFEMHSPVKFVHTHTHTHAHTPARCRAAPQAPGTSW